MKTLALIFAIAIGFTGTGLADFNCGISESEAHIPNSRTWNTLKARFKVGGQPRHWEAKKAKYWRNTLSNSAPPGADAAIIAAANSWSASSFQGDDDFDFKSQGQIGVPANRNDGKNVVSFQGSPQPTDTFVARTYIKATERGRRDRLKDVDTIMNTRYYWAVGADSDSYDVQSVMAHEFGHWLVLYHLFPGDYDEDGELGCDEFLPAIMYYAITRGQVKRNLHWIDDWGKWYIYSSGNVNMAPSIMPMEFAPALQDSASVLQTRLLHNYPDPFNPETWIPYELGHDADVRIEIYDSVGARVRLFDLRKQERGRYYTKTKALHWDGRNDSGEPVTSGVYFYTLNADGVSDTQQLVILK